MESLLTSSQQQGITALARVCSSISLLACIFVILTYSLQRTFRTFVNRFIFYASVGNVVCCIATLMARGPVSEPDSASCQVQGFLIQMCVLRMCWSLAQTDIRRFMPADALWTLAMAINVHFAFVRGVGAAKLRTYDCYYLLLCYGLPFLPALAFCFIKSEQGGRMYGDATTWCWIRDTHNQWRFIAFYGPVW